MIISISRAHSTSGNTIIANGTKMVQTAIIESRSQRTHAEERTSSARKGTQSHASAEMQFTSIGAQLRTAPMPNDARTDAQIVSCASTEASTDRTLRESADANPLSVATSMFSCATSYAPPPTPTLSPNGSPKLTRKNSFHSLRRPSTASSQGSDCPHCVEDATVRSTIGYSDDEDDSSAENESLTVTVKQGSRPATKEQLGQRVQRPLINGATSVKNFQAGGCTQKDDEPRNSMQLEKPKSASIRRTQSLTTQARRKVVSMRMPSNFALAPTQEPANSNKGAVDRSNSTAEVSANAPFSNRADEGRVSTAVTVGVGVESASGSTGVAVQRPGSQRKAVPVVSNVIPIKGHRVMATNPTTLSPSPPSMLNEEAIRSLSNGKLLAKLDDSTRASSHERLVVVATTNSTLQTQPANDKLLLPDKNLFHRKSQWNSETTLNTLPQSPVQAAAVNSQTTPKTLPQALTTNTANAHTKRRSNVFEDPEFALDENNHANLSPNNASVNSASGPLPVKASHVQQPLKHERSDSNGEQYCRMAAVCPAVARTRSNKPPYHACVNVATNSQHSEYSTLNTTTTSAYDDTDIDVGWDELSGVASDESNASHYPRGLHMPRAPQSTQHEINGVLETYETYLNELEVITRKERQLFEQVRANSITAECWRDTAKKVLQFKVSAVKEMRKVLDHD